MGSFQEASVARALAAVDAANAEHEASERQYVDFSDYVKSFEPPDWLIDNILLTGRVYSLTAMTGHFKTAFATYAALSVACGAPVAGLETRKCRVLYLSGENDEDQKARTIATASEFGLAPEPGYFRVLAGSEAIGILRDDVPRETKALGPFGLVIVDTSIAYFGGEDENNNVQLKEHASMFRELGINLGGATVLILCHPTKAPAKDNLLPRGGGAFLNEIDGNLTLYRTADRVTLSHQGKFRGASFEAIEFQQKEVILRGYTDAKGRPVGSVVVVPMSEADIARSLHSEWQDENKVLYELLHYPQSSMADHAKALGWMDGKGNPYKTKIQRIINDLAADGLVKKERKKYVVTPSGKKAINED